MNIPRIWEKVIGSATAPDGADIELTAWGWSHDDRHEARRMAQSRLARLLERVTAGQLLGKRYPYAESAALREEILEEIENGLITRNTYGSLVLNMPDVMFVDVDLPEPKPGGLLRALFGKKEPDTETATLTRIQEVLQRTRQPFRIYRTAAGFRILATGRTYEPGSRESDELMVSLGADPSFMTLCRVQKSFRARLSPKPWRCGCPLPPGRHPRTREQQAEFAQWLQLYARRSDGKAVCRFVAQAGSGPESTAVGAIVRLHDDRTGALSGLPLA